MKKKNIELYIIMLIAIFSRLFMFGKFPGGVNVDEAFAGYESWSLINYGMDSWGYTNPVYFIANGSGMNVLNSYLMMPFVYAFGLNKYTIRIPQVVFGILTVYVLYLLIKKIDTREKFEGYYFTIYQDIISENQISGADKALEYALDKKDELDVEHIFITSRLRPAQVLFYTKTPTDKYISSVTWENYPSKYLQAASFDCFTWKENDRLASEILIVLASEAEEYEQKNYDVTYFENCAVVISD